MTQVYEFYDMGMKMPIIRNTDVELIPGSVENTYRRILVSPDKGSGAVTLGELIVGPGTELAMHTHRIGSRHWQFTDGVPVLLTLIQETDLYYTSWRSVQH